MFFLFFSLFIFLCCFPFCFPRCATLLWSPCFTPLHYPVVGSKSSSQPLRKLMTQDLCPSSNKIFQKSVIFIFSFDLHTDIILKQFNKLKKYIHFFTFLCCFPFCFPRCASLLWSPLYYPVALPRCWVEVLEPTVEKIDDLGLVPIFKKIFQKSVIFIFSFDLCTGIILKQFN